MTVEPWWSLAVVLPTDPSGGSPLLGGFDIALRNPPRLHVRVGLDDDRDVAAPGAGPW